MDHTTNGDVELYTQIPEDTWAEALIEIRSRAMGHGFGQNTERGFYIELMPEGRTPANLAAVQEILNGGQ